VVFACFEYEHRDGRVGAEAVRKYTSRGAGADDHDISFLKGVRTHDCGEKIRKVDKYQDIRNPTTERMAAAIYILVFSLKLYNC
jgi:hypothetical protein